MKIMSDAEYFGIKLLITVLAIAVIALFLKFAQSSKSNVIEVVNPYVEAEAGNGTDDSLITSLPPDCGLQLADKGPGAKPRVGDGVASRRTEPDTVCDTTNRPDCDTVSTESNRLDPQNEAQDTAQLHNIL